jgi:hypothetical protein
MDIATSLGLDEIASWMKEFVQHVPRMLLPTAAVITHVTGHDDNAVDDVYYNL